MYWNMPDEERLIFAIKQAAETPDKLRNFLRHLLTEDEIQTCVKRLKTACLIYDAAPYEAIQNITGFSPTTIARISKQVNDRTGGYQEIIRMLDPHGRRYFE
jgi:uncharacterized protein YerC